ncbi:Rv2231c family pyridoxal phosphate-dependent protein CobC [Streptomyces sp. NBC_00483]|uniref:Rv2231c family pyridoxal phosphate-dependent protein CobC n=1 Tax=Streptomyces sp. NBC_00483 TaxID=2975756 RepID=UPI003FCC927B
MHTPPPALLAALEQRLDDVLGGGPRTPRDRADVTVLLVGAGSADSAANAELAAAARLLWEGSGYAGVEPAYVSAAPDVPAGLDRCAALGARRVVVLPYGALPAQRLHAQAVGWAAAHPEVDVRCAAAPDVADPVGGPDLRHHGDAEVRDDGEKLTDLAVNVRTGTPPSWLREHIAGSLEGLAAYPDGRAARAAVAAHHGVPVERVLLTAGAAEAFVLLARALRVRRPVVVHPQFTEPEAALEDAGHAVGRVLLREEDGFRLDPALVPHDADLVVVGNPTNPTSVLHPADALTRLARPGRFLVVDEAFMDAVPGERESLAGRTDVPGLVVLRSLTKTWGLAGLRVGYVVAEPEVVAALERAQPLWPVSSPALVAAQACVSARGVAEAADAAVAVAADREYLVGLLRGLASYGVSVAGPAEGPFVLVRIPGAGSVRERLRGIGFAVRRGDTFPGLGPDWVRLAVRDRGTCDSFVAALAGVLHSSPCGD